MTRRKADTEKKTANKTSFALSPRCREAIRRMSERYGMSQASVIEMSVLRTETAMARPESPPGAGSAG